MHDRQILGVHGEQAAAAFLREHGYVIMACNVRWRGGEVDIIARHRDVLAFVEVKTRRYETPFPLSGVVTPTKQRKIIMTARHFVAEHKLYNYALRFDIALVILPFEGKSVITHIPHAFTAPDGVI